MKRVVHRINIQVGYGNNITVCGKWTKGLTFTKFANKTTCKNCLRKLSDFFHKKNISLASTTSPNRGGIV